MEMNTDQDGWDDFLQLLRATGDAAPKIAKRVVYDGAGVAAAAVTEATRQLQLDTDGFRPGHDPLTVITAEDREDLAASVGISRIIDDGGTVSAKISFDGYIRRTEKDFPRGVPAVLIARSIESGSSVRAKRPFMRRTVNRLRESVPAAMQSSLDESIAYILRHNQPEEGDT